MCGADGLKRILNVTEEQITGQEDGKHRGRIGRVSGTEKVHLRMKEEIKLVLFFLPRPKLAGS